MVKSGVKYPTQTEIMKMNSLHNGKRFRLVHWHQQSRKNVKCFCRSYDNSFHFKWCHARSQDNRRGRHAFEGYMINRYVYLVNSIERLTIYFTFLSTILEADLFPIFKIMLECMKANLDDQNSNVLINLSKWLLIVPKFSKEKIIAPKGSVTSSCLPYQFW